MKKDLTAIKNHCQDNSKPIPILRYILLETFFQGLKYFQQNYVKKTATPVKFSNLLKMVDKVPKTFNGLIWKLGIGMAWSAILRTSEWANDYSSYKTYHTEKTIYFDNCIRNWPENT